MVCKSCEAKLSKVAASDPFRNRNAQGTLTASGSRAKAGPLTGPTLASSGSSVGTGRKVGENKLLGAKNRFNPLASKCTICKGSVQQDKAKYCQGCAFKRGMCSMCGKPILDDKVKRMSKMSST